LIINVKPLTVELSSVALFFPTIPPISEEYFVAVKVLLITNPLVEPPIPELTWIFLSVPLLIPTAPPIAFPALILTPLTLQSNILAPEETYPQRAPVAQVDEDE